MEQISFEKLVHDHGQRVYRLANCMLNDPQDAEDAAQEIFYQACRSLPKFKGNSSIDTWLHRIAMNVIIGHIRKKQRTPLTEDGLSLEERDEIGELQPDGESAEDAFIRRERLQAIRRAVLKLPEIYRAPFVLNVVEGYAHQEIGKILRISAGTARIRLFRAIKMIREDVSEA